jgi:uncharacterized protein involved in exopolysaccharide biosynthesis
MTSVLKDGEARPGIERSPSLPDRNITLLDVTTLVFERARLVATWMLVGFVIALLPLIGMKRQYAATAAFGPENSDASRSGVSALAGQLGLNVPGSTQSQSQLYAQLLKTRAILDAIVRDTFTVAETGERGTLVRIAEIRGDTPDKISERAAEWLARVTRTTVDPVTSTLSLRVSTQYRSLSLALARDLLRRVNEFNVRTRQSQASAERAFVDRRLALARDSLLAAEGRLKSFLESNRQVGNAPELMFARDRLQREVQMRQQIVNGLAQSYEDASIREVRDTPVITIIDPPSVSATPESRDGLIRGALGLALGAVIAIVWLLSTAVLRRRIEAGDPDAVRFAGLTRRARLKARRLLPGRSRVPG